jgi:hypothetical protein
MTPTINKVNYFNKASASPSDDAPRVNCQTIEYTSVNPHNPSQTLRIIAFSDTHGQHAALGQLPHCDILIFAGNMLSESKNMSETEAKDVLLSFNVWLGQQTAKHKIVIGGNHDQKLEDLQSRIYMAGIQNLFSNATYLCNTSITIEGLNIVGIPFSVKDTGNQGFQSREATKQTEDFLNFLIERNTKVDVLVTHGPCENIATMLKPKLAHISGRAKNNYGIGRIMHVPLEIEGERGCLCCTSWYVY